MKVVLFVFIVFLFPQLNFAATVSGIAKVDNSIDYSGIRIDFIAKSQSAVSTFVYTLTNGNFSASVVSGVYDIKYSKSGYQDFILTDQFLNTDLTLSSITLSSKAIVHVTGNVQGSWSSGNTYQVDSDITVPVGQELIIEKGTRIEFTGAYRLTISGKITAIGELNKEIVFTSNKAVKSRGDWSGIFTNTTSDSSRFIYCIAEYASPKVEEQAIFTNTGALRLSNTIIRGAGYGGIYNMSGGKLKLDHSEITDCYFYGFVSTSSATDAKVTFTKTHHIDLIGVSCQWSVSEFRNNTVNNTGYTGIQTWGDLLFERNMFYNNPYGIFVVSGKPTIRSNTFYKNGHGIGFYDSDFWHPSAIISSNIIFQNNGYGIYCESIYAPEKVEYNIINGNPSGVANRGPVGLGTVVTTNKTGYSADTYYNIFANPSLVSTDETNVNFLSLSGSSAAIDSGDPQFTDADNSVLDCGAISFQKYFQTISFPQLDTISFGHGPIVIPAVASSGLPVTFASSDSEIASINLDTLTIKNVGEVNITASQSGSTQYRPAVNVIRKLVVKKANQIISFAGLDTVALGHNPILLSASSSSGLPVTLASSNSGIASIQGSTLTINSVGETNITATQGGDARYMPATTVSRKLVVVQKAPQAISFAELDTATFGHGPILLSASASSGLHVTFVSSNSEIASIQGSTLTINGAGTVSITAMQNGTTLFEPAIGVSRLLVVKRATQTISFPALGNKTYGDQSFGLSATTSSGLPVSYSSSNAAVATVNGNTLSIIGTGSCEISAIQNGNGNYLKAADVKQTLTVSKANQTITFQPISDISVDSLNMKLNASSTSNLSLTFSTNSTKVKIVGSTVQILSAGKVTITASQLGNSNYLEATSVDRSFCINPKKPIITITNAIMPEPTLISSNKDGNQWFENGTLIAGANQQTLTVSKGAAYTVKTIIDNCQSPLSDQQIVVITGGLKDVSNSLELFPNPAKSEMTLQVNSEFKVPYTYAIVDALGRVLANGTGSTNETKSIEIGNLPSGIYFLKTRSADFTMDRSFVKVN